MVIQKGELKVEIQEVLLAEKLDENLHNILTCTPGIDPEEIIQWNHEGMQLLFLQYLKEFKQLFESDEKLPHVDRSTNLEILLTKTGKIDKNLSEYSLPDSLTDSNRNALVEYYSYIFYFFIELGKVLESNSKLENTNILAEIHYTPNLKRVNKFLDLIKNLIPEHRLKSYDCNHFTYIGFYVKNLNTSHLNHSILVRDKKREEFEAFIDNVFSLDSMITEKQKKNLKTFFHYQESGLKQIEPMYFEVDEDAAFYIAFFIKKAGASPNSIINTISKLSNVTDWLNANIKVKSIKGNWSDFKNYQKQFRKLRRVKKIDSISKSILNHK
jgi:hypothetical protein